MVLENHFTTSEQSKRLLELEVPLTSADCVRNPSTGMVFLIQEGRVTEGYLSLYKASRGQVAEAAWTDGRLKEIWKLCGNGAQSVSAREGTTKIELLVKLYEENAAYADFSKLEE